MGADRVLTAKVTHRFEASPGRVFDAWLDPDLIGRWMFGPAVRDEEVVRIRIEPRVGGKFSYAVRRQGQEADHVGEILELDRPRRLVFTWATADSLPETSRVIVEIAPLVGGCELTLTHELGPGWADYLDRTKDAWTKMLAALAKALGTTR